LPSSGRTRSFSSGPMKDFGETRETWWLKKTEDAGINPGVLGPVVAGLPRRLGLSLPR